MRALSDDWIEVFWGSPTVALLVRDRLEGLGVRTYVPDENLRFLEPFSTGGQSLDLRVLVPRDQEEQAREILEEEGQQGESELSISPEDRIDPLVREVTRIGDRIVFATALGVLAPAALWMAPRYFKLARRLPAPPRRRALVIVAVLIAALETVAVAYLLAHGEVPI
jgi:hypothetical protein